ncbi:hypothetical protein [Brachyspira pilosicoli]|uniref:Uncharacterized protein n=1 Tax=Brachyspira pilosicoli TaxID=52584 RepID=A0A5C8FFU5_BRAPL|nr:hypothetical protein [Brachyspira pilosicoli]TXJ48112.1 hypothetical protein EPJ72_00050 [Brachyspira pilosicoli]
MEQYITLNEKTTKEQIKTLNEIIKNNSLYKLSNKLEKILYNELKAGNKIREISVGGFGDEKHLYIFLNKTFITKIVKNYNNIKYIEINDPHYWKAEYTDIKNKQTIACPF